MFRAALFLPLVFVLSACSIYKSTVRKDFEDNSPERVHSKSSALLGVCEKRGMIPAWLEREFPGRETELLVADADLDVRLFTDAGGKIVVRADRLLDDGGLESCKREFSNERQWIDARETYLRALGIPVFD